MKTAMMNKSRSLLLLSVLAVLFAACEEGIIDNAILSQDNYLTFEALESTTFTFSQNALQYSLDGGATWATLRAGKASPTIQAGKRIMWKASGLAPGSSDSNQGIGSFSSTGKFNAEGNVMSLLYGDNLVGQTSLNGKNYAFYRLFYNSKVVNAGNLVLPATTLAEHCYHYMFFGCINLTNAPSLPATTLANSCYEGMFYGCTSLTTAPNLPATTLARHCYDGMFTGCTILCFIKCLATDISATGCTYIWVSRVATSGTFVKNASMTGWTTGKDGIPSGWTVQDAD